MEETDAGDAIEGVELLGLVNSPLRPSGASFIDKERTPSAGLWQDGHDEHRLQRSEKRDIIESEVDESEPEMLLMGVDKDDEPVFEAAKLWRVKHCGQAMASR